jgi:F-type H+-transporting ATPase subunit b
MLNFTKLCACLAAFWFCAVAFAPKLLATDAHAAGKNGEDHSKAAPHDKPEKDPIAFTGYQRWDLAAYTVVVFGLVFVILSRYAFPNIVAGLKKREDAIAAAKDEALVAKAEAEAMRKKLADEFAVANDKIRALLEEARRDADALRVKEREVGQKEAATERERAKREIEAAKDAALQEIYQKSVDLATMISTKAVRRTMSADDHRRLVDESLADLKNGRI